MTMTPTAVSGLWRLSTGEYITTKDEARAVLELARQESTTTDKENANVSRR